MMTVENLNKHWTNQSYAYFEEGTYVNVTDADVRIDLLPGSYVVYIDTCGSNNITISDIAAASSGTTIPWDVVISVIITATVSVTGTYYVMNRRK
jgi:hypothetical protein